MVEYNGVRIPKDALGEFCRQHGARRLSLFGSILRRILPATATSMCSLSFNPASA